MVTARLRVPGSIGPEVGGCAPPPPLINLSGNEATWEVTDIGTSSLKFGLVVLALLRINLERSFSSQRISEVPL